MLHLHFNTFVNDHKTLESRKRVKSRHQHDHNCAGENYWKLKYLSEMHYYYYFLTIRVLKMVDFEVYVNAATYWWFTSITSIEVPKSSEDHLTRASSNILITTL